MGIEISVIVPTFDRRELLQELIESLLEQTLPPDRWEVFIVVDGSRDGTIEMVRGMAENHRQIRVLEQANCGPAVARNQGVREARGKYLVFTDDDCVVSRDWLASFIRVFEETGALAVHGRTSTIRSAVTPLTHQVVSTGRFNFAPTCNAGYRRSTLVELGGFDEGFPHPHNEDTDLAWRVERLGKIVFSPEVRVIHPPRLQKIFDRARWVRFLESEFRLHVKHPDIYRKRCGGTPWRTIYWRILIVNQLGDLKSCLKYLWKPFRPRWLVQGMGLVACRSVNLLCYYGAYRRAALQARAYTPASVPRVAAAPTGKPDPSSSSSTR